MASPTRTNGPEARAAIAAVLRATALAARIQRRLALSDAVGWPVDVRDDLAEGRRHLRHAEAEIAAARARTRFEARYR